MNPQISRRRFLAASGAVWSAAPAFAVPPEHSAVSVVRTPASGTVPDVALDGQGVLHLTYGRGQSAFYARSRDGGRTFAPPVLLNQRPDTVTVGGERGPKLALGCNNTIHVVWQGHYQKGGGVWYVRSTDGGKSFSPERNLLDSKAGIDMPTITADAEGNVIVLWLDGRLPETPENPVSSPLFLSRSLDNGTTFSPNRPLEYNFPGRGCACCMLWARIVKADLWVAYRTGYKDVRDVHILRGPKSGERFRDTLVSPDKWVFHGCPMSGPRFSVAVPPLEGTDGPNTRVYTAWMSQGRAYWSFWDTDIGLGGPLDPNLITPFQARQSVPGSEGNYPMILDDGRGRVLVLWTRQGETHWALYPTPGTLQKTVEPPLETGMAGAGKGRPSLFVKPEGGFCVVL